MGSLDKDDSVRTAVRKCRSSSSKCRAKNGDNSKKVGDKFTRTLYTYILQTLENEAKEKDQTMKQLASALKAQQRAMEVSHCFYSRLLLKS